MLNWSREQGRKYGIVVVIKRSNGARKIITRRARVTLGCERGGHYIKKPNVDWLRKLIDLRCNYCYVDYLITSIFIGID